MNADDGEGEFSDEVATTVFQLPELSLISDNYFCRSTTTRFADSSTSG